MTNPLFANSELAPLIDKVEKGERLNFADGVRILKSNDLLAVGYMANLVRSRKNGAKVFFNSSPSDAARVKVQAVAGVNGTSVYAPGISAEETVEQILHLRKLQDEAGGFLVFSPFQFNKAGATEVINDSTGFEDLKILGVARILLDNFDHIQGSLQIGPKLAQVSLSFGVDDLEPDMSMTKETLIKMIQAAGLQPVQRDEKFNIVGEF